MWRPSTTRQSVSGVDRISPTGPHSHAQKMAEMTTDTGDSPVLWPYTSGSTICPVTGSTTRNSATVDSAMVQPGSTAAAMVIGSTAEPMAPT